MLTNFFRKCVGTDFVCETNDETLKIKISYSHFAVQATTENIAIKSLLFAQDEAQSEQENLPILVANEEEKSILNAVFHDDNALFHWKVISIVDERKVMVEEHGIVEGKMMGITSEFNRETAMQLITNECA